MVFVRYRNEFETSLPKVIKSKYFQQIKKLDLPKVQNVINLKDEKLCQTLFLAFYMDHFVSMIKPLNRIITILEC